MNLDELRTVQSKERSKDSLQHLRESFYGDVADYVADLRERRDTAAERAEDPFADPEVTRLTDEIQTAEEVVEGIYERRVGKVVKRASLAAMGVAADSEGLTTEEQELFESLVDQIETNKQSVLDVLAEGESVSVAPGDVTDGTPTSGDSAPPADVSAADVMGGEGEGAGAGSESPSESPTNAATGSESSASSTAEDPGRASDAPEYSGASDVHPGATEADAVADANTDEGSPSSDTESGDAASPADSTDADDPLAGLDERTTVRVTDDVGEIFGVDERTYDLASEDVVTLPEANAEPLLERGAAEKLE